MNNQYQKWVNLSYLSFAALVSYVFFSIAGKVVSAYDLEVRFRNIDLILRGTSISLGFIIFFVSYRNRKVNQFMNEVMSELSSVTWPTQKETSSATLIVVVMVIISSLLLGFLDNCWTQLLRWVL